MLETKFTAFALDAPSQEAADATTTTGRFSGYASLFDLADETGDRVAPGAFDRALARGADAIKMLWQHDPNQPIGVWESLAPDARGLRVTGRLILDVQAGREAAALLAAGALDGLSIGFQTRQAESIPGGRRLLDIQLWEISLVTFPMLAGACAALVAPPSPGPSELPADHPIVDPETMAPEPSPAVDDVVAALSGARAVLS